MDSLRRRVAWTPLLLWVLLSLLCSSTMATYDIGVGKSDVTGPAAEIVLMGYADSSQTAAGILNRLYARAYIVEDTETKQRVVFVICDLHSIMQLVHQEVVKQLEAKYDGLYSDQNVVLHATHTHGGPGGVSAYFLYDVSIYGFINENYEKIVRGIMKAIDDAHASMAPGSIHFNKGQLANANKQRSPEAYEANPKAEQALYDTDRDIDMRVLQLRGADKRLRGVLAWYPVHPTSLTRFNRFISGDNKGYAEFLVEEKYPGVAVGIGVSNAGDVSPNLVDNGDGTFSGEGTTDVESAEIIGSRQAAKLLELLDSPTEEIKGSVIGKLTYVDFSNTTIHSVKPDAMTQYANRTCPAIMGQNFAAGTEDGRGLSAFKEGDLQENKLFRMLGGLVKSTPDWVAECHTKNKVPLLAVGLMNPVPWVPSVLPVQVVKIGQFGIAVTNFEVSTMAGRRIRSTVQSALSSVGVKEVEVASMSNAYAQYVTTEEEYMTQHYEGASTLFGPNQLTALQQELARVAQSVANPSLPLDRRPQPRQFDRSKLLNFQRGVILDTTGWGMDFGDLRQDVQAVYSIGETVSASFYGAHPRNLLDRVSSFCDVEKQNANGKWEPMLTDSQWDVRYEWYRVGISESRSVCKWVLRTGNCGVAPGSYRIRHRGFSKSIRGEMTSYEGVSSSFQIVDAAADDTEQCRAPVGRRGSNREASGCCVEGNACEANL